MIENPESDLSRAEGIRYQLLRALEENPACTQRELAARLGISLGRVNYCLRALLEKGLTKVNSYRKSGSKARIVYLVTPKGAAERMALTGRFLERKLREYDALTAEIENLRREGGMFMPVPPDASSPDHSKQSQ